MSQDTDEPVRSGETAADSTVFPSILRDRSHLTGVVLILIAVVSVVSIQYYPTFQQFLVVTGAVSFITGLVVALLSKQGLISAPLAGRLLQVSLDNIEAVAPGTNTAEAVFQSRSDGVELLLMIDETESSDASTTHSRTDELSLTPVGAALLEPFEDALNGQLATDSASLAAQVTEAVVDVFEFAELMTYEVKDASVRFTVRDVTLGDITRVTHPIPSFVGTVLSKGLNERVHVAVRTESDGTVTITARQESAT